MYKRGTSGKLIATGGVLLIAALAVAGTRSGGASMDRKNANVKAVATDDGFIEVVDGSTGKVLHTFAKPAGVVREIFALGGGSVVTTSQKDFTEFWNAGTGQKIRRFPERIYAFGHDERSFVTFTPDRELKLYDYPGLTLKHDLGNQKSAGPSGVAFSPDDRYLAVAFCTACPLSDKQYGNPTLGATLRFVWLFELSTGTRVSEVNGLFLGSFSEDSRYYRTGDGATFDLASREFVSGDHRTEKSHD